MTVHAALSEHEAKALLASYGVPVNRERVVSNAEEAVEAAQEIGFPSVVKLCGAEIMHKTELGGVKLGLTDAAAVATAASELLARGPEGAQLLVAEQVSGTRELIAGVTADPHFGPTLMFGVGGIFAEVVADVVFRVLPVSDEDVRSMIGDLANPSFLGEFRGEPAVDIDALARALGGLARCAIERPDIESIDINPLIVSGGRPVAVDALVVLS